MTLDDVLRLLSEHGIMHTIEENMVILGNEVPSTLATENRQHPGAAQLVDLYTRMGWTVLRSVRDADLANTALQRLNATGIKYRWSDLGPEGYLFALPLGDVPAEPTPAEEHKPGTTETLLSEEGWTVLATYSRAQAGEWGAALDMLAQYHLVSWKQVDDEDCFLLAVRVLESAASEGAESTTDTDAGQTVTEEDALLQSYYRHQGYVIVSVPQSLHYTLSSCLDALRKRGMAIVYHRLPTRYGESDTERLIAVRCGAVEETKYGGRKGDRDAALRKDGWAILVTFSPKQAANVRATLERMHAHGVPLEWKCTEEGGKGTHIAARCSWPPAVEERHEGDGAIVVVSADDGDEVRHAICHGLRDLDSAGMDMQWGLRDDVVTVSPWDAF